MDIEKLIEAAKHAIEHEECLGCPLRGHTCYGDGCEDSAGIALQIINHYENLLIKQSELNDKASGLLIDDMLRQGRVAAIEEVREFNELRSRVWPSQNTDFCNGYYSMCLDMVIKLDSMEPDKGDKRE